MKIYSISFKKRVASAKISRDKDKNEANPISISIYNYLYP